MSRLLVVLVTMLAGCVIDDIDQTGKACPCAGDYTCDALSMTCRRGPGSVGGGDGGTSMPGEGVIKVADLKVAWTTPNTIRWEWTPSSTAPDQLLRYELVVGTNMADIATRAGGVQVFTDKQNPELGRYYLPRTGGQDTVVFTMSDGHQPATTYYGQLTAIDTGGKTTVTNIAAAKTADPPTSSIDVFTDNPTKGYSIPAGVVWLTTPPNHSGAGHYQFDVGCDAGTQTCFDNLRRQDLQIGLGGISQGSFLTTAFVEVWVATDGMFTPYWCDLWLSLDGCGADCLYHYSAWTMRNDGKYRVLQVPLRALMGTNGAMTFDKLALGLFEVSVGGEWSDGGHVYLADFRIRY